MKAEFNEWAMARIHAIGANDIRNALDSTPKVAF
jgi:hypothetical protein